MYSHKACRLSIAGHIFFVFLLSVLFTKAIRFILCHYIFNTAEKLSEAVLSDCNTAKLQRHVSLYRDSITSAQWTLARLVFQSFGNCPTPDRGFGKHAYYNDKHTVTRQSVIDYRCCLCITLISLQILIILGKIIMYLYLFLQQIHLQD